MGSLKEVPEMLRTTCFQPLSGGKRFKVKPALRTGIKWLEHNFFLTPPGSGFHLIFIRNNLLTYYQGELMQAAFNRVMERLVDGGILIVGSNERLPRTSQTLKRDPLCPWVFWSKGG